MIDEQRQDQASLYVLRMLPPAEALEFARELEKDPELQQLVSQLEDTASTVALAAPHRRPPSSLRSRVLVAIRGEPIASAATSRGVMDWIPWTLAAGLALTAGTFWYEARTLRDGFTAAQRDLAQLRAKTLKPTATEYEKSLQWSFSILTSRREW
jgi:anti-sigma-K factor RskA